ncbi:MAG: MMPL family transporter, partial [Gaiellaceae bacterium]
MFQELGLGVAVALLLDATIVRVVLVPAAMSVLGRWNWWPSELSREPVDDATSAPTQVLGGGLARERG